MSWFMMPFAQAGGQTNVNCPGTVPTSLGAVPVLLYHDFVSKKPASDPYNYQYVNTPQSLEQNLRYFLNQGYTFINFEMLYCAYLGKVILPQKPIILTFDDGYLTQYTMAFPVLKKLGVHAEMFIVTDFVGREIDGVKYFSYQQAKEMQNSGLVSLRSHATSHVFFKSLAVMQAVDSVDNSFELLSKNLGASELKVFAYPYGSYTSEIVEALVERGVLIQVYDIGLTTFDTQDYLWVKRIEIPFGKNGRSIEKQIEKYRADLTQTVY